MKSLNSWNYFNPGKCTSSAKIEVTFPTSQKKFVQTKIFSFAFKTRFVIFTTRNFQLLKTCHAFERFEFWTGSILELEIFKLLFFIKQSTLKCRIAIMLRHFCGSKHLKTSLALILSLDTKFAMKIKISSNDWRVLCLL